ncbi:MAG: dihydrodipicolinate reductase, partial [Bacteriovoracaceae bacterium]
LGTGINPGLLMDTLPLLLSTVNNIVDSIQIDRIQDASTRRKPFQKKIGYGLNLEEFNQGVHNKTIRHVGLRESHDFLNHYLNFKVNEIKESIEPIIRKEQILGVSQTIIGLSDGDCKIKLKFDASIDEPSPMDRILIHGVPGLEMKISNAVQGDEGTIAVIINVIPALLKSTAGLKTMADLTIPYKW